MLVNDLEHGHVNGTAASLGVDIQQRELSNDQASNPQDTLLRPQVLIVGTGPAGAALACFLSSYGITGIMVSRAPGTADSPRAHITNMAALECLRDIGLDVPCLEASTHGDCMIHTRWCHSMAGAEYARVYSWGNDPKRKGDYAEASPCDPVDLPQTLLEPILVKGAVKGGFECRFNTSFVSFGDRGAEGVVTMLRDDATGKNLEVHSEFLFGADGARSRIMKQLDLPLISKPGGGVAINVIFRADLSHLVKFRQGNLHWVIQPDQEICDFAQMAIVRMVKPWHEWIAILLPKPGVEISANISNEDYMVQVKRLLGDVSIPVEILSTSRWQINETVAGEYSSGNVHCLGDAVHRHPPFNGLGSNTCIQDAFNLAWKVAYVMAGQAKPSLLATYNTERQPVGHSVITRANDGLRDHLRIWDAIGILPEDINERKAILAELTAPTPAGEKRRLLLREATHNTQHEFHGVGIEMNQLYTGNGIYTADEPQPFKYEGPAAEDPILYHERSTYPGHRLPHAWLNKVIPQQQISTIDLAGKGKFALFTGIGGQAWVEAAALVGKKLNIPLQAYTIGFGQEWVDVYDTWAEVKGVQDDGVVLVRPDRFVAWRAQSSVGDRSEETLLKVIWSVLGFEG